MRDKGRRTTERMAQGRGEWEPFDEVEWPDSDLEIDDAAFAAAIAAGRTTQAA